MTAPEVRFQEPSFHDDDIAAVGDEVRDVEDTQTGVPPQKKDLC